MYALKLWQFYSLKLLLNLVIETVIVLNSVCISIWLPRHKYRTDIMAMLLLVTIQILLWLYDLCSCFKKIVKYVGVSVATPRCINCTL